MGIFKLMEERGIKKYDLRKQGIHAAVVDKLINNNTIDTTTINKLCKISNVQPADILEYVPDADTKKKDLSNSNPSLLCLYLNSSKYGCLLSNDLTSVLSSMFSIDI